MSEDRPEEFDGLIALVRRRISLGKNKRLRDALSVGGDPAARLAEELPAAVIIEWDEAHPGEHPSPSPEEIPQEEIASLTNRVARRLERQADEKEEKVFRAVRRGPGQVDDHDEDVFFETLGRITKDAGLSPREKQLYRLLLDEYVDESDIPFLLGLNPETVAKYKYRMMLKLRKAAAEGEYSEKFK